jgi:hypothetical protein
MFLASLQLNNFDYNKAKLSKLAPSKNYAKKSFDYLEKASHKQGLLQ